MRISAPPFLHPCYYGTDIDSEENLIACHHTTEEIAEIIGADSLGYLDVGSLGALTGSGNYCAACFKEIIQQRYRRISGRTGLKESCRGRPEEERKEWNNTNTNYKNLKDSYLFYHIAQKTKAYLEQHPGASVPHGDRRCVSASL